MKKVVSIIIPFKNETLEQLGKLLSSINSQIDIDFEKIEVVLINDGGQLTVDLEYLKSFFNFSIKYFKIENVGPGLARQYGIDHTSGEYLMFMDGDDILFYSLALYDFFNAYKEKKHEIIIGRFIEQYEIEGGYWYKTHNVKNFSAVYAKWFKRSYLKQIDLRFHPDLRIYEDIYFVGLACNLSKDIAYMDKIVYAWLCNENSMMRSNNHLSRMKMDVFVLQHRLFLETLRDKRPKQYRESIVSYLEKCIVDIYSRFKLYGAEDEIAFWKELHLLSSEFSKFYPDYSEELWKLLMQKYELIGKSEMFKEEKECFKKFILDSQN